MFADKVIEGVAAYGPLCVGIDPHPGRVPALFGGDTAQGLSDWGEALVALCKGRVAAIKPQVGLFERLGPEGMTALQHVCRAGRNAGVLVLADAKRGDIGSTAEGYASAYLDPSAPFEADAVTVNPYMGIETLEPFMSRAEAYGKGVIVLARTSNPGASDFQARDMGGAPLYSRVVEAIQPLIGRLVGTSGWSGLMLVAGATGPEEARRLRGLAPEALFLVPGYGAQGAGAAEAMAGFVRGQGGLVNASRSVTFSKSVDGALNLDAWRAGIVQAIEAAQADLKAV